MARLLILFAHPALEKSRVHSRMVNRIQRLPNVTFHDLYEEYPDFDIDVRREQKLLLSHDIIIFQHPFYWYSSPAIIKEWQDLVLVHKWAYGAGGTALTGKKWMNVITCGGSREAYSPAGLNKYTIPQLLAPFERTARLCNMDFLPPFVVHATHRIVDPEIAEVTFQYHTLLAALANEQLTQSDWEGAYYMNDLVEVNKT